MLSTFMEKHRLPQDFQHTVENSYMLLAEDIYSQHQKADSPLFVGINGSQGSGKSTLSAYIGEFLSSKYQLNVVVMSLDDFYLSSKQRKELANTVHPLLATRGVPGTHNVELLNQVLEQLSISSPQQFSKVSIPKFDKSTDEPFPLNEWNVVEKPADIVILEGWCWGVPAQPTEQLSRPINELEQFKDIEGTWRTYVNQQLKDFYEPLYQKMNYWVALQAPSFDCVYHWRVEQEEKLKLQTCTTAKTKIMDPDQLMSFVQFFQRLTVHGISTIPELANAILYLDSGRTINNLVFKSHV